MELEERLDEVRARIRKADASGRPRSAARSRWSPSRRPSMRMPSVRRSRPANASSAKTGCRRRRANGRPCARKSPGIELHLIGPLQSNKAAEAVALFDVIETVDREKIAARAGSGDEAAGQRAAPLCPGQHRPGAAEGGHRAG